MTNTPYSINFHTPYRSVEYQYTILNSQNTPYCLEEQICRLDCKTQYVVLGRRFDTSYPTGGYDVSEVKDDFKELPTKDELRIKTSIQDPPTNLETKPLPQHLEYAFLEENSLLPVVISALIEQNEKERLDSVLKNHKEAFA
ncbi:hypothetical protein Tco_0689950 [Tanacetum coccineum]